MEIAGVLAWLLFGIVSAVVAKKKGRSGCAWFALGVLLGPFGLILAFAASPQRGPLTDRPEPSQKKCPSCGELIRREEVRCRSCEEKASRPRISVPPGPDSEHWACPRCGTANARKSYRCGNCGYSPE